MEKIFTAYKIVSPQEALEISKNGFKTFLVDRCEDFRIFNSEDLVVKCAREFQLIKNIDAVFYAKFDLDFDYFENSTDYVLLEIDSFHQLNTHILHEMRDRIILRGVYQYKNELISIPKWVIDGLLDEGVEFSEEYFDYVLSYRRPYKGWGLNLFIADLRNKKCKKELGRIVVYRDVPTFYEDVLSAVLDNYEKKYRFGFENLHNKGVFPSSKLSNYVEKFGVRIKESKMPVEHPYIAKLNFSVNDLYKWKYGKRALKCYNDSYFRDQDDGQLFEDFKAKEVRYRSFTALFYVNVDAGGTPKDNKNYQRTDNEYYYDFLNTILDRYSYNGASLFQDVQDLNKYENMAGIYILSFEQERKMYIGQTKKCLKTRIVQHFNKPQSEFDKSHSLQDVTKIFVLSVPVQFLDQVEIDCIASVPSQMLFNVFAGGDLIMMMSSERYNPEQYILDEKSRASIISNISTTQ